MAGNNDQQTKGTRVLSDKKALMRTLERMQKKQELCMKYLGAHHASSNHSNRMHDSRNLIGLALMQINVDDLPEEEWDQHYNFEIGKMVGDFNTPDPATGMPYPEMVKPYIKNFYDNLTTSDMVTDWSDEKQIERFLCTLILNQAQATVLGDFSLECIELYPESRQRELLDAKCGQVNIDFYAADRMFREYRIKPDDYISLSTSNGAAYRARFEEYITGALNEGIFNDNNVITLNYGSFELMDKFLKGEEFLEKESLAPSFEAEGELFESDYGNSDFNKNFVDLLTDASIVMPFERLVLSPMESDRSVGFTSGDLLLINGKPLSEIMAERGESFLRNADSAAEIIRGALTDGRSVVELMRVGFENDGRATFRHQEIKVDLDQLNSSVRKENHNIFRRMLHNIGIWKIPDRYPSNSQRDVAQNGVRNQAEFLNGRTASEKSLIEKYNSIEPVKNAKVNSFSKNFGTLKHQTDPAPSNERMEGLQNENAPDPKPEAERVSFTVVEVAEANENLERSEPIVENASLQKGEKTMNRS